MISAPVTLTLRIKSESRKTEQIVLQLYQSYQVKLENKRDPDNINWYKVTEDGDVKLYETEFTYIKRGMGKSTVPRAQN